jgi:hypothetical protein
VAIKIYEYSVFRVFLRAGLILHVAAILHQNAFASGDVSAVLIVAAATMPMSVARAARNSD